MTDSATRIVDTPEWRALQTHYEATRDVHLRTLFADDPDRGEQLCLEVGDLYLDYSKNRLTAETMTLLAALARRAGVEQLRDAMFAGEKINITEDRAVLHVALRAPKGEKILVDGVDVVPEVHAVLEQDVGLLRPGAHRARGPGTPASGSATSSTSGSAAATSGRAWRRPRWPTSATVR